MLFNSVKFIFGFFSVTVLTFSASRAEPSGGCRLARADVAVLLRRVERVYVPLLVASAAFNCVCGVHLARFVRAQRTRAARALLASAASANLLLLGYYKYANFFLGIWGSVTGNASGIAQDHPSARHLVLHLHPVASLADIYRGYTKEYNPTITGCSSPTFLT